MSTEHATGRVIAAKSFSAIHCSEKDEWRLVQRPAHGGIVRLEATERIEHVARGDRYFTYNTFPALFPDMFERADTDWVPVEKGAA